MTTKQAIRADVNTFVQGLITENSLIDFPPNAIVDGENFIPKTDRSNERRLGLDAETNFVPTYLGYTPETTVRAFRWNSVNGLTNQDFLVLQVGNTISFFDLRASVISRDGFLDTITLTGYPSDVKYAFAAVDGKLTAVCGDPRIVVIKYEGSSFEVTTSRLKVRDLWGLEETVAAYENDLEYRGADNVTHRYNLRNQSWAIPRTPNGRGLQDPIDMFKNYSGNLPSNAEQVWSGLEFTAGSSQNSPYERFYPRLMDEVREGSFEAARGYFIIDLLDRGLGRREAYNAMFSRFPAITAGKFTPPTDYTTGGATALTEWAGRVFFAGFNGVLVGGDKRSPTLGNQIAFSQLVRNELDVFKCHQSGDPTSRDSSDIIATDGGLIRVSGAESIINIQATDTYLVVLATNGVWLLMGGNNYGFDATNYKTQKVSTFGCIAPDSVIVEGTNVYYWSEGGIFVSTRDQFGDPIVQSITDASIKTFYEAIPLEEKRKAIGSFDSFTNTVRWLYNVNDVTYELVFDTNLQAFYRNKIGSVEDNNIKVVAMFTSPVFDSFQNEDVVTVEGEQVTVNSEPVTINTSTRNYGLQETYYLAYKIDSEGNYPLFFCYFKDPDFTDWATLDDKGGVDAEAYMVTGPTTTGDVGVHRQVPYIVLFMKTTETGFTEEGLVNTSSCFLRSIWDWSFSTASNRYGPYQQGYRHTKALQTIEGDFYQPYQLTQAKLKFKGRGRSFSIEFRTEPKKDCKLVGWSLNVNSNSIT